MERLLLTMLMVGGVAALAWAEPVSLSPEEMDAVTAGKITEQKLNRGGNEPQGEANGNGITTINVNPAGNAPPGQN